MVVIYMILVSVCQCLPCERALGTAKKENRLLQFNIHSVQICHMRHVCTLTYGSIILQELENLFVSAMLFPANVLADIGL